jgi:hypothetical protein
MIKVFDRSKIVEMWNAGKDPEDIIATLNLTITPRQIYRIGARYGSRRQRWNAKLDIAEQEPKGIVSK